MATLFTKITAESAGASPYEFAAVNVAGSNTFAPSTTQAESGSYSYETAYLGTSAIVNAYESFASAGEIYVKFQMYLSADFAMIGTWGAQNLAKINDGQWHPLLRLAICSGGTAAPYRWYITGTNITDAYSTSEVTTGAWQEVEMYWKYDAGGNGEYYIKIDGTTLASDDGLAFTYTTGDRLYIGGSDEYSRAASGSEVYYDEIEGYDEIPSAGTAYEIAGSINAVSGASAGLTLAGVIAATINTAAVMSGDTIRSIIVDCALSALSGITGDQVRALVLSGMAQVVSGATGDTVASRLVAGVVNVVSGALGDLSRASVMSGSIDALSGVTGDMGLVGAVELDGVASAISGMSGGIGVNFSAASVVSVLSGMAGDLAASASYALEGIISAVSNIYQSAHWYEEAIGYSTISEGQTNDSIPVVLVTGDSTIASGATLASGIVQNETYESLITSEVAA